MDQGLEGGTRSDIRIVFQTVKEPENDAAPT
jgi:hypothetical protein